MYLFLVLGFFSTSLFAEISKVISVQGSCNIESSPDRGSMSFTAENQSKNQVDAINKTNEQINRLRDKIKGLGLNKLELKTTNLQVYPVREYEKDRYIDKGVKASSTLEVSTSEIKKLGDLTALAVSLNFQNIGSLQTYLSNEKKGQEHMRCLDIATDEAQSKATQLAKKLKINLGPVVRVVESPGATHAPVHHERFMLKSASADVSSAPIEPGTVNFSSSLQIDFAIR